MDDTTLPAPGDLPARGDEREPGDATTGSADSPTTPAAADTADGDAVPGCPKKRRRGSRGGKGRKRPAGAAGTADDDDDDDDGDDDEVSDEAIDEAAPPRPRAPRAPRPVPVADDQPELPERIGEGRPSAEAAEQALVRRPQIGDTRPAIGDTRPAIAPPAARGGRGPKTPGGSAPAPSTPAGDADRTGPTKRRRGGKGRGAAGTGAVMILRAPMSRTITFTCLTPLPATLSRFFSLGSSTVNRNVNNC
jgi:hypothetical protein